MRIAFVTSGYPPDLGGVETVVREVAVRTARAGHAVEVFAPADSGSPSRVESRDGVLVHRFSAARNPSVPVLASLLIELVRRRNDFDIVHAHNYHAFPALVAAAAHMRPLIFTPHYHGHGHSRAARAAHIAYGPMARSMARGCAQIICVSRAEAASFAHAVPGLRCPISVVPNGVAVSSFADARPFDVGEVIVLAAGRMVPYKQFDLIAEASRALPAGYRTVLLGDGPMRPTLQAGANGTLTVTGRVSDDVRLRWFRTASVLVSMSRHESFGLTLTEALAAGTPVVASDIPAHREIAESQPPGAVRLVSPDTDPLELARVTRAAVEGGLPDRVVVSSWDDVTRQVLGIYERL
jgi:glycosyltransferase involved in cell wall biosynthesis